MSHQWSLTDTSAVEGDFEGRVLPEADPINHPWGSVVLNIHRHIHRHQRQDEGESNSTVHRQQDDPGPGAPIVCVLGIYAAFMGNVLTALFSAAQNKDNCSKWWVPFTLCALFSVAVSVAIVSRFTQTQLRNPLPFYWRRFWSSAALTFIGIAFCAVALASCRALLC